MKSLQYMRGHGLTHSAVGGMFEVLLRQLQHMLNGSLQGTWYRVQGTGSTGAYRVQGGRPEGGELEGGCREGVEDMLPLAFPRRATKGVKQGAKGVTQGAKGVTQGAKGHTRGSQVAQRGSHGHTEGHKEGRQGHGGGA